MAGKSSVPNVTRDDGIGCALVGRNGASVAGPEKAGVRSGATGAGMNQIGARIHKICGAGVPGREYQGADRFSKP